MAALMATRSRHQMAVATAAGAGLYLVLKMVQKKKQQQQQQQPDDVLPFRREERRWSASRRTASVPAAAEAALAAAGAGAAAVASSSSSPSSSSSSSSSSLSSEAGQPLTYASVVRPLQLAPNYKTNPLVCQSKFLQHCSTNPVLRAAAEDAGARFAAFKAASRRRADVFAAVEAYAATAEAAALPAYERHFLDALLADFRRGGLGLRSDAERGELQRLLDADTACCSRYKTNLNDDATALHFAPEELRGLPQSFIDERAVAAAGDSSEKAPLDSSPSDSSSSSSSSSLPLLRPLGRCGAADAQVPRPAAGAVQVRSGGHAPRPHARQGG